MAWAQAPGVAAGDGSAGDQITAQQNPNAGADPANQTSQTPLPVKQPTTPLHIVPFLGGQDIKQALPGLFAPPGTHMAYFGGLVIPNVHLVQVLYGTGSYLSNVSSTTPPSVASFFTDVTQSSYMDLLSEYSTTGVVPTDAGSSSNQFIGHGFFDGQFSITPAAANNGPAITDNQIQSELLSQVTAGKLPAPVLDVQGNNTTLYMVYFPPGKTITVGNISSCVRGGFCAYHNSTVGTFGGRSLYYGVLPDMQAPSACSTGCGSTDPFQNVTIVTSHELAEAISDANVGTATTAGRPLAWADPNTGAEIGDVCTGLPATISVNNNNYSVQQEWSNLQNSCTGGPVTYFFQAPFNVVPGSKFDLTVNASSSPNSISPLANYRGTIHFTSSDAAAVLPADYTYTFADAGSHTFVVTLNGSGSQTITATDMQFPFTGTATLQMQPPTAAARFFISSPQTANTGTPVTVLVAATDAFFNPAPTYNGTVHFTSTDLAATLPADASLVNGAGTFSVTFNTAAAQTLTVADATTTSISGFTNFNVLTPGADTTATALTASPNPSVFGQPVTYIATVTGGNVPLSGTVGFNIVTSAPLDANGHAQATMTLPGGTQTVFAEYSGTNKPSSSAPFTAIVNPAPTTVALTSSQSSGSFGGPVTFTATVSPTTIAGISNSGFITFSDGGIPIAVLSSQIVNSAVSASFTTSALPVGQHTITASFAGNSNFAAATSTSLVETVNPAGSADYSLTANVGTATVAAGQTANFTFTTQSLNGFTGTIKFTCGNLPSLTSCAFSPATEFVVTAGSNLTVLNIKTTGPHASLLAPASPRNSHATYAALWGFAPFAFGLVLLVGARRKDRYAMLAPALLAVLTVSALAGCGGGPPPPPPPPPITATPAGTTTVTVTATATPAFGPATTTTKQLSLSLTVTP